MHFLFSYIRPIIFTHKHNWRKWRNFDLDNVFKNYIKNGMLKNYGFLDVEQFLDARKNFIIKEVSQS